MIIILSFNHPHITARCVSSVLKWVHAQEIVLFHNGSSDQNREFLEKEFPSIRHAGTKENRGYSGGVNAALKWGFQRANWIFLLTNDTEILSWSVDFDSMKDGIYSPFVWLRKKGRVDFVGGLFDSTRGRLVHLKQPWKESLKPGHYLYAPGTAFLISKKVFEKVGDFDESLHTYWEDVDFGARATRLKIPFGFIPEIEVLHQSQKTTRKDPYYSKVLFKRNRWIVSSRHCPWFLRWRLQQTRIKEKLKELFRSRFPQERPVLKVIS